MTQDPNATNTIGDPHRFDTERLARYLREHVARFSGALQIERFEGGQSNPTFLVKAGEERYVLRRKPPGKLLPSAHAVDREYRVIRALAGSGVPVPTAYALCEDESVIGTPFYVMAYVEGRILWDAALPGMTPAERAAMYDEMNRVLALLHGVDPAAIGLADYGRPGNYLERQVARWTRQYQAAEADRIEAMENLIAWLPEHVPSSDETGLVHGDYRLDNLIFHPSQPRILAVLDWELSTLGHPLADLAYQCMVWRLSPDEFRGLAGRDLVALGIPSESEYVAAYVERAGRSPIPQREWEFYVVYNLFRLAAILHGVMARAVQGNASSQDAMAMGQRARPLAEAAWRQAEQIAKGVRGDEEPGPCPAPHSPRHSGGTAKRGSRSE